MFLSNQTFIKGSTPVTNQLQEETRAHYNQYHFIEGGSNRVAWWREYLADLLPEDITDKLFVDVGSSVGEISRGLIDRGARLACIDLSIDSLRRCRQINQEADIFNCSALDLPFPDESFDHAISIGVLHHTPDCRRGFHEVARVTAPGGTVVIFLYNYWNIYNLIYNAFWPIRRLVPLNKVPLWMVRTMQPFARAHLKQKLDDEQLRNLLGDKLWTPQATFHSVREVSQWGVEEGLDFIKNKRFFLGYANVMQFRKQGQSTTDRREISTCCVKCGTVPMIKQETGFACSSCDHTYTLDGGICMTLDSAN